VQLVEPNVSNIWDVGRKSEVPAVDKAPEFRPHVIASEGSISAETVNENP
jgi:hypothetical protein